MAALQASQTREPEVEKKTQLSINKMQIPDISVFRDLNLHGSIRIGELSFNDIQSSGIHLTIESGQDRFDIRNPTQ